MKERILPKKGDVIMSSKFAFGYYEYYAPDDKKKVIITIDGKTRTYSVSRPASENERMTVALKNRKISSGEIIIELGAYDPSRADAKFIVQIARDENYSADHRPYYVRARRLKEDDKEDPNGEVIHFYMSGNFACTVLPEDVQIIKRKS